MVATAFFVGCVAGNLSLGKISDIYGRKKIFLIFMITNFLALSQLLFLFHYVQLIVSAFLLGLSNVIMGIGTVLLTENIDKSYCARIMGITNAMFPLGGLLNTLIFYLFSNWRVYFIVISFLNTLAAFIYLQESLKWLQHNNKQDEYVQAILYILKLNGKEYNESILNGILKDYFDHDQTIETNICIINNYSNSIHREKEDQLDQMNNRSDYDLNSYKIRLGSSYNIFDLFLYRSIRRNSFCLLLLWIISGFSFYGLFLNLSNLTGDIYINSVVAYSGEFLGEVISGYLADLYGRRTVTLYSFSLGSVCSLGFIVFSTNFIKIPLLFLSVMGIASAFNILYIFTAEMYPTNIKSLAMSFFSITNNLTAATTPYFLIICPDILMFVGLLCAGATITTSFLLESMGYNPGKDVKEKEDLRNGIGLCEKLLYYSSKNRYLL